MYLARLKKLVLFVWLSRELLADLRDEYYKHSGDVT